MAQDTFYICNECGQTHTKWAGKCDGCGAWNSISAETATLSAPAGRAAKKVRGEAIDFTPLTGLTDKASETRRLSTGFAEFDRVLGGGVATGAAILIGGDPGVGKSTLLLQATAALAKAGHRTFYITGEESPAQLHLRAARLNLADAPVELATETNVANICKSLAQSAPPDLLVIDSIQTMWSPALDAAPGTVSQVRLAAQELIHYAKKHGTALILVGHVTKDGQIAGPRVLEHMVDTVIYFESERGDQLRILRTVKNRFGPAHEIGVFEMQAQGLAEIANPSSLFLETREENTPGAAVFAGIEGTRPLLVEIQALVAPSSLATPRRAVVGWNPNRLSMVLAVLEARGGLSCAGRDVFLNIAGGLHITEPAADLAVAAALVSSLTDTPLPRGCVVFGEISLSGTVRPVTQTMTRVKEATRLGFDHILTLPPKDTTLKNITPIADVRQLIAHLD